MMLIKANFSLRCGVQIVCRGLLGITFFVCLAIAPEAFGQASDTSAQTKGATQSDTPPAKLAYPEGAQPIVTTLGGLVTGSQQAMELGRANARLTWIRAALTGQLLNANPGDKISIDVRNEDVLCLPRGAFAEFAASRGYINTVASGLQAAAKPSDIKTLGDAVALIFHNYAIEIDTKPMAQISTATKIVATCKGEIKSYTDSYFPKDITKIAELLKQLNAAEAPSLGGSLVDAIAGLFSALNAIVTPIATTVAAAADERARQTAIKAYLIKNKDVIVKRTMEVSDELTDFSNGQRWQALGQFSEQLAAIRKTSVPLSEIDSCKVLAQHASIDKSSDEFLTCYAAVWKRYSEQVASALKAADQYDQYADAIPDANSKNTNLKTLLEKQFDQLGKPKPIAVAGIFQELVNLIALTNTVTTALSSDNRTKLSKAIDGLVKGF